MTRSTHLATSNARLTAPSQEAGPTEADLRAVGHQASLRAALVPSRIERPDRIVCW